MTRNALPLAVLLVALAALAGTVAYALDHGAGNGPMHRSGYAMMGGAAARSSAWYVDGSGPVRDIGAARTQAQRFADRLGLRTAEIMQFANNFYVRLDDAQGRPATEVLVDPRSGDVTLEYGAAMMWNTRYGMMAARGGMMGGVAGGMMGAANGGGPVDAAGARAVADRWLAARGLAAGAGEPDAFPGYYTMETRRAGRVAGMISVNARTGAVMYHWWHGGFVAEA